MRLRTTTSGIAALAAIGLGVIPATPAQAVPDKQFPVQVTCNGNVVGYVSPMLGADPIWVDMNGNGSLDRYAIVYASDYLGDQLLFEKAYGAKTGYGDVIECTHYADWGGGIVIHGELWLAAAPS